jgi:hypothetical protein
LGAVTRRINGNVDDGRTGASEGLGQNRLKGGTLVNPPGAAA